MIHVTIYVRLVPDQLTKNVSPVTPKTITTYMEPPVLHHAQMVPMPILIPENVVHVPHHAVTVTDPILGNVPLVHLDTIYMMTVVSTHAHQVTMLMILH